MGKGNIISNCTMLAAGLLLLFIGCSEPDTYPRRHGFHRIDFPDKTTYKVFDNGNCPFTFQFPDMGTVTRSNGDSCWTDISFPSYGLKWHFSYKDTRKTGQTPNFHFEEHRKLIYKHTKKATEIRPSQIMMPGGRGTMHEVYGNVGSPAYYFLSDTTGQHVFMLSLYFNTALKNDSLAPVIDYMKGEALHAVETLRWE